MEAHVRPSALIASCVFVKLLELRNKNSCVSTESHMNVLTSSANRCASTKLTAYFCV